MKLRHLEIKLERLAGFENPNAALEQYVTPASVAARLLFHAHMKGDIEGKRVADLGCGAGILSCGAALLGAESVVGVDIDPAAIEVAEKNAEMLGVDIEFLVGNVAETALPSCDTVIMNPPFGAQNLHADRPFIDRALATGSVVYGIFNTGSLRFVRSYTEGRASVDEVISCEFTIRHTFAHHKKERVEIPVEIIRLLRE